MILKLYRLLTYIAGPAIDIYLQKRKKLGKEDALRFDERLGKAAFPRPDGTVVWIHAASVGEALSVLPIIKKLAEHYPGTNFLLTTGTITSAKIIESRLPDNTFHQYVPVDKITAVRRFLRHWKPNLALWVESELWPNLVTETARYCPIIMVNGRISDNSYKSWQNYSSFSKEVLSRFSLCLPQSKHDAERFEKLGARNVKYLGNIKFDAPPLPSDPQKMGEILTMIGQRQIWMAASTHSPEERMIAEIHKELKETHPDLLTIIAPRHPKRMEDIIELLKDLELNIAVRSKNDEITEDTDIYLADTIGELGVFYRMVPIVFIGGSIANKGGQNPLEAARLDCTIVYGPHMDNFIEIKRELEDKHASLIAKDKGELFRIIDEMTNDHDKQESLAKAALDVIKEKQGVTDKIIEEIKPYIERVSSPKNEAA